MKKFITILLSIITCFACMSMATSCGKKINKDVVGVYEMVEVSGTIKQGGYTTQLDKSLYEYYRITLNKDGSALVESKGTNVSAEVEAEGTWEWDNGQIKLKSTQSGITTIETMDWEDGVITYEASVSSQGMEINMVLVLERVSDK